ncbi:hypothetical protein [Verrucomicrobium spinosum]|uniref:hypothetical protein n=1 Tax=Verrucomicrobium spinosum TaxID=2736 RepID=UPI002109B281|nr:hypothetical protein [Verrucomicrobium spinosum]
MLSAVLLSLAAYGISQTGVSVGVMRFLDNFHWTLCYLVAAWLGWQGMKTAVSPEEKSVRRWFAWGLLVNAGGQIIWDLQVVTGWNPFPAPADVLYSALGPCCAVGLWQCLRANTSKPELRVATLDAAALGVGATAFVLTLYLQPGGDGAGAAAPAGGLPGDAAGRTVGWRGSSPHAAAVAPGFLVDLPGGACNHRDGVDAVEHPATAGQAGRRHLVQPVFFALHSRARLWCHDVAGSGTVSFPDGAPV